jgi:hypothetical protein
MPHATQTDQDVRWPSPHNLRAGETGRKLRFAVPPSPPRFVCTPRPHVNKLGVKKRHFSWWVSWPFLLMMSTYTQIDKVQITTACGWMSHGREVAGCNRYSRYLRDDRHLRALDSATRGTHGRLLDLPRSPSRLPHAHELLQAAASSLWTRRSCGLCTERLVSYTERTTRTEGMWRLSSYLLCFTTQYFTRMLTAHRIFTHLSCFTSDPAILYFSPCFHNFIYYNTYIFVLVAV